MEPEGVEDESRLRPSQRAALQRLRKGKPPLYGVADYSELNKDAPMTSLGVDELEDLLHRLKLLDYLEAFRENGCDQVADVALMRESDLREIGMKLGHIRRLLQHFEGGARR